MSPRGGQARAFALRRQRDRHTPLTDDGHLRDRPTPAKVTHDQAEQYERLRQAAEALGQLKPQEIRALQLKAEGYSYREICQLTGWTFTKTSFCLFCLRKGASTPRGVESRSSYWLLRQADAAQPERRFPRWVRAGGAQ